MPYEGTLEYCEIIGRYRVNDVILANGEFLECYVYDEDTNKYEWKLAELRCTEQLQYPPNQQSSSDASEQDSIITVISAAVNIRPFILKQILAQGKYIVLDPGNCPFKRNQILDIYEYKEERDKYENDFFAVTGKSGILKIIQNSGFEGVTKYRDIAIALGVSQNIIAGLSSGINYKYEDLEIKNLLKAKLMTLAESLDEKPVIDIPSITPSPISKYMWYMLGLKESVPIDCLLVRGLSYSISDEDKECFYNLILSLGDSRQKASDMLNDKVYEMVIEELDLSVRAFNCLKRHGINTVGDLVSMNESGLKDIRNLGEKCIEEIIHKLALMGLVLESSD